MNSSPLLIFHILAAIVGLLSGAAALIFRKGSRLHKAAGNVCAISLLIMSASGAWLAFLAYLAFRSQQLLNVIAGVLTFYWVATGWLTLRRRSGSIRHFEFGAMLFALADGTACLILGWGAMSSATGLKDGYSAAPYLIFGSFALLSVASDVSVFVRGGVSGAQRIARHLWRMCAALLVTTMSFFIGKQRLFPEAVIKAHLNVLPILIVAVLMIFWLVRVLFTSTYSKRPAPRMERQDVCSMRT